MAYASLPFEVPGVTCPLPPSDGERAAETPDREPVLLSDWPTPPQPPRAQSQDRPGTRPPGPSQLLEGLSSEQRRAVTHGDGPLLISAGPGTGKTTTLAARAAYLAEGGLARPHEIVAVTFTRRAVEELRLRLIELPGSSGAASVNVCTIHKLCAGIVRAHAGEFGRNKDYLICDRTTSERLAREVTHGHACAAVSVELERCGGRAPEDLLEQISLAKNSAWNIEDYLRRSEDPACTVVAAVWQELEVQLRAANAFDFEDLLVCAVKLLQANRGLREHYRERYRWMLIDEFQDVNVAQMELVRLLMAPNGNLTVAGDEDQCLYAWRLADPENILNFTTDFPCATSVTLSVNRRSRTEIIRAASCLIEHNKARVQKDLVAVRAGGAFLGVRFYPTDEHEAFDLGELIATELELGRVPREILVLCSKRRPLEHLQRRLEDRGIKLRVLGGRSLWERSEIRDAIASVQLLSNPYDRDAYERAATAPRDRKPFSRGKVKPPTRGTDRDVASILTFAERKEPDLIKATLRIDEIDGVRANAREPLREFAAALNRIRRAGWLTGPARPSLAGLVDRALKIGNGPVNTYEYLRDHAESRSVREDANRVLEDLRSLTRAAERYEESAGELQATLVGFLDSLDTEGHEVDAAHDDRVTLATVHSAKGTEAEIVIVIAAEEDLLPDWRATGDQAMLEGQRRLIYTAVTRAKDNLLLTHVATRDGAATEGPSRFLAEAGLA